MAARSAAQETKKLDSSEARTRAMQDVDKQFQNFYETSIQNGHSLEEIQKVTKPFLDKVRSVERKERLRTAGKLLAVLLVLVSLYYLTPMEKMLWILSRQFAVMLLPVWDWTQLYYNECFVENPFYQSYRLELEDCLVCEDMSEIERRSNISQNEVNHNHLYTDRPVIISDAVQAWPAYEAFTSIEAVFQEHDRNKRMKEELACSMVSNIRQKTFNNILLLERAANGEHKNFYAFWENCEKGPSKALRMMYKRPYFLSPMVEMSASNWLFVSRNYKGKSHKKVSLTNQMVIYTQIFGSSDVQLLPRQPCNETCTMLNATLARGDLLLFTDNMWKLKWLPSPEGDTVGIATSGFWD